MGVVQLSTLSLYLLPVSLSLTPSLFLFFPSFFCSHAAARRQEQHEQTGFHSLAAFIHLPKTTSFPPIEIFLFSEPINDLVYSNLVLMWASTGPTTVCSAVIMLIHMPPNLVTKLPVSLSHSQTQPFSLLT